MNDLIYSLNATMPVFLVIAAGYLISKTGMFSEGFISSANKFIFNVCLPLMVFSDMARTDIRTAFHGSLVAYSAAATTVAFVLIWVGARLFIEDKTVIGAFVQAAYRSSVAVMGFAFMQNIYGGVGLMPIIIIGCVPLYNIYAVTVLTFEANVPDGAAGDRKAKIIAAAKGIIRNPIIIGIVAGSAASLLRVYDHLPLICTKTIDSLSSIATPLSLIVIGASFEPSEAKKKLSLSLICSAVKLVAMPLVFVTAAVLAGFRGEALLALVIMLGSPTTPSCYIMAKNMNNDGVLTSGVIALTTLLSSVTLTLCIYIVKSAGLI